jgi:hypothetical protein
VVAVNPTLETPEVIRRFLALAPFQPPILLDRDGRPAHTGVGELDREGAEAQALLQPLIAVKKAGVGAKASWPADSRRSPIIARPDCESPAFSAFRRTRGPPHRARPVGRHRLLQGG